MSVTRYGHKIGDWATSTTQLQQHPDCPSATRFRLKLWQPTDRSHCIADCNDVPYQGWLVPHILMEAMVRVCSRPLASSSSKESMCASPDSAGGCRSLQTQNERRWRANSRRSTPVQRVSTCDTQQPQFHRWSTPLTLGNWVEGSRFSPPVPTAGIVYDTERTAFWQAQHIADLGPCNKTDFIQAEFIEVGSKLYLCLRSQLSRCKSSDNGQILTQGFRKIASGTIETSQSACKWNGASIR